MAVGAGRGAIRPDELGAVNIGVAAFASSRRHFEIHIDKLGFKIGRLVTIDAGYRAMCSDQRKGSLGMIEAR